MQLVRGIVVAAGMAAMTTAWLACSESPDSGGTGGSGAGASSTSSSSGTGGSAGGLGLGGGQGTGGAEGCNPQSFVLQQSPPPEIYLVIDRSGSMNDPGVTPNTTKWDEMNAAVDQALTQYQDSIHFGLLMYPTGDECATSGPQVSVGESKRQAILNELSNTVPAGGTPSAAALNNASASLSDLGDPASPKFVVLATDGGPNCNYFLSANPECSCSYAQQPYCCTNQPGQCFFGSACLDDQGTLDAINALGSQGIDTFVIGLAGTAEYVDLLNAMAQAGGRPQQGGTTDYYAAADQQQLSSALQTIAVSVISCQIQLDSAPQYPDEVKVFLDGQEVPRDKTKTDGWDYTDDTHTTIELYGSACDKLQDGQQHTVTAEFGCIVR